jgi:hypothetical protein
VVQTHSEYQIEINQSPFVSNNYLFQSPSSSLSQYFARVRKLKFDNLLNTKKSEIEIGKGEDEIYLAQAMQKKVIRSRMKI